MNNEKLKTKYPSHYDLELHKLCSVSSRIVNTGNFWEWKSCPLLGGLSAELERLKQEIASCQLQPGHDKWTCLLPPEGSFTVEAIKRRLDKVALHSSSLPLISWCKVIPIKVLCFVWRAA